MYCYKCGREIDDEAIVCPGCGCATPNYQGGNVWMRGSQPMSRMQMDSGASKKSRLIALLLCIFLGLLGVHRFYVKKVGTGLLWLFTYGCFSIGWIVDIVMIACGSFLDGDGRRIVYWDET